MLHYHFLFSCFPNGNFPCILLQYGEIWLDIVMQRNSTLPCMSTKSQKKELCIEILAVKGADSVFMISTTGAKRVHLNSVFWTRGANKVLQVRVLSLSFFNFVIRHFRNFYTFSWNSGTNFDQLFGATFALNGFNAILAPVGEDPVLRRSIVTLCPVEAGCWFSPERLSESSWKWKKCKVQNLTN